MQSRVFLEFFKRNIIFIVAVAVAILSMIIIPPDKEYLNYIDYKTISCLFITLAVVCALKNIDFFYILAVKIVSHFKTTRRCVIALVSVTFFGSMIIANDMALITFLPLGYYLLTVTGKQQLMAYVFILQNIAANLGGMLMPFGNPQSLYIYTKYNISVPEFIDIMIFPFIISMLGIMICCIFISDDPVSIDEHDKELNYRKVVLYLTLFAIAILIVFRIVPYICGIIIIPVVLFLVDRKALAAVDYPLLLTFVAFFILSSNLSRMDSIREFFSGLLNYDVLLTSVCSCQLISNVPTAILFSQFTDNYRELLLGVNIGGVGTLVASLASLITFREYIKHNPNEKMKYIAQFSILNFAFLTILVLSCLI